MVVKVVQLNEFTTTILKTLNLMVIGSNAGWVIPVRMLLSSFELQFTAYVWVRLRNDTEHHCRHVKTPPLWQREIRVTKTIFPYSSPLGGWQNKRHLAIKVLPNQSADSGSAVTTSTRKKPKTEEKYTGSGKQVNF